ncbi:MAG: AmmeMemoRadiSam system protein B [Actinobacteria bacterium]|nr:AmmeMemoRadiSam system protein B [Actinomycetota bacterium]
MDPLISPVREAAVAGQFYPGSRAKLERAVKDLIGPGPKHHALGVMVPHAGYMYSGRVAGDVTGDYNLPKTFVILGPNHTGLGPAASIMSAGVWRLPTGDVRIAHGLAEAIESHSQVLASDERAHLFEHSIEVQIPFLQYLVGDIEFVPISLMTTSNDTCRDIGLAIAAAIKAAPEPVLVVASSDMSHYESQVTAQEKDQMAIEKLLALDPEGLLRTVMENHISMCGVAPAAAMLYACRELGASDARLAKYETSGDVTGDYTQVVGYAGVIVS